MQHPLVLLVAAGRPDRERRAAVAQRDRRRQRRPGPRPGASDAGQPVLEPEHLRPRSERPAECWDHRRALEPAAARRGGDEVAEAVGDVEVNGVAAGRLAGADRRCRRDRAAASGRRRAAARPMPCPRRAAAARRRTRATAAARAGPRRRRRTRRGRRRRASRTRPRHGRTRRPTAPRGRSRRAARAAGARQGPGPTGPSCTPRARGSRALPAIRASPPRRRGRRRSATLPARLRSGRSRRRRSPRRTGRVHARAPARATPHASRRRSAGMPPRARGCGRAFRAAGREVQRRRSLPGAQQLLGALDRQCDPGHHRIPLVGVADREREDVLESPGAELGEQPHPAGEGPRHAGGQEAGAGDELVPELPVPLDRRGGRRDALAQSTSGSLRSADQKTTGRSPPGPLRCGSTTWSVNPAATAASNALPPRSSTAIPAAVPSQCVEATIPNVPRSSGLVVKVMPARWRGRGAVPTRCGGAPGGRRRCGPRRPPRGPEKRECFSSVPPP